MAVYLPNLNHKLSLNVFYSQLSNVIDLEEFPNTNPGYQNYDDRVSKGIEFEYFYRPKVKHNLYFNATYLDTDYVIPPEDESISIEQSMPDISKIMFKAMYIYRHTKNFTLGTTWRYFSETTSTELDWIKNNAGKDPTITEHHILDETITYRFSPSSQARLTIKNLLNSDARVPSYYYRDQGGMQREGTNYFLTYIQTF